MRNFELHGVALKHSPLQQFYNVLGFKTEYESKHGPIKSEALSKLYEEHIVWANPDDAVTWSIYIVLFNELMSLRAMMFKLSLM